MTNYMGKRRLLKILLKMLSDRPELLKLIKKIPNLLDYRTYRGSEWLKLRLDDYGFEIYASGGSCKAVAFQEYRVDGFGNVMLQYNRIVTKYNEVFEPLPLATWYSGGCEQRKRGYYPFHNDNPSGIPVVENLNPDTYVCYDIAKKGR